MTSKPTTMPTITRTGDPIVVNAEIERHLGVYYEDSAQDAYYSQLLRSAALNVANVTRTGTYEDAYATFTYNSVDEDDFGFEIPIYRGYGFNTNSAIFATVSGRSSRFTYRFSSPYIERREHKRILRFGQRSEVIVAFLNTRDSGTEFTLTVVTNWENAGYDTEIVKQATLAEALYLHRQRLGDETPTERAAEILAAVPVAG